MNTPSTYGIPFALAASLGLGIAVIGVMLIAMHRRHTYSPNLIGALLGALLCFLLLEALPALT